VDTRTFSFTLQMESFALGPQRSQQMGHTAAGCVTANIGGNNAGNVKTVTIASAAVACPDTVSATNWIGPARYGETFKVTQSGAAVSVLRTDRPSDTWSINLQFLCCPGRSVGRRYSQVLAGTRRYLYHVLRCHGPVPAASLRHSVCGCLRATAVYLVFAADE
jgi:hypothetical protein